MEVPMKEHLKERCIYNCEVCGQSVSMVGSESDPPECCDEIMKKQDEMAACEFSDTAEHSRFDDPGEPCDDGRG